MNQQFGAEITLGLVGTLDCRSRFRRFGTTEWWIKVSWDVEYPERSIGGD